MRNRPQLITTVSQEHYDLLQQEQARIPRPLSYVLDEAIQVWATFLRWQAGEKPE